MVLTRINNNVSAINATRNLNQTSNNLARSLERLSSGLRINRAADDAAGLSISERQRSQIRGLQRAVANAQDAISLVNTGEGALNETTARLQRIRELAVQAANSGGQDAEAIQAAQDEIETAIAEITRISQTTQFSTRILLNGDNENAVSIRQGTPTRGVSVSNTTVSSSLPSGTNFLRITQTQVGTEFITVGSDAVGNVNVSSITDNTFDSGEYNLTVSNVTQSQTQIVGNASGEEFANTAVINLASTVAGTTFQGVTFAAGDRVVIRGTGHDGSAILASADIGAVTTFTDLRGALSVAFDGQAAVALTGVGTTSVGFQLTAVNSGVSQLSLELLIDDASASPGGALDGVAEASAQTQVSTLGSDNTAVLTLDAGPAITASAGETVTLYGREPATPTNTDYQRQVTLTFAASNAFLREGNETLNITQNQYTGSLNGGRDVSFAAGQKEVLFRTGIGAGFDSGDSLLLDFGTTIDLSGTPAVGDQATVILSSSNSSLNFQIGANEGQNLLVGLSDLSANKLGFRDGLDVNGTTFNGTVDQIDVRSVTGAENAIRILDRALAQVSRQRSFLGATTNRLEATIANLGVAVENLTAAESRIRDADIAVETTQFTRNQILVQAGTSILAQANLAPQSVLQLLG